MLTGPLKCHYCNLPAYHLNLSPDWWSHLAFALCLQNQLESKVWKSWKNERAPNGPGPPAKTKKKTSEKAVCCLWALILRVISILITHLCLDCITHWITGNYDSLDTVLESRKSSTSCGDFTSISILFLAYRFIYFIRNQTSLLCFPAIYFGFSGFCCLYSLPEKG